MGGGGAIPGGRRGLGEGEEFGDGVFEYGKGIEVSCGAAAAAVQVCAKELWLA